MRGVALDESAEALRARILAHVASESEPELAGVVILRLAADVARESGRMPAFLPPYLLDALSQR